MDDKTMDKSAKAQEGVIDLLSDDDEEEDDRDKKPRASNSSSNSNRSSKPSNSKAKTKLATDGKTRKSKAGSKKSAAAGGGGTTRSLQGGIVLEEDCEQHQQQYPLESDNDDDNENQSRSVTVQSYIHQQQQQRRGEKPELYHDPEFESAPASIEGSKRTGKVEKCRCSPAQPVELDYITKGPNKDRPYVRCAKQAKSQRCQYFRWAFQAERMHWYRFGQHTGHVMVRDEGFTANDLLQGKVGDCWFLSALAVIAERPDLIMKLIGSDTATTTTTSTTLNNNPYGIVQVNLFLDGYWRAVVMDNFLPCIIDDKAENQLQQALQASLGIGGGGNNNMAFFGGTGHVLNESSTSSKPHTTTTTTTSKDWTSSKYDPFALSDKNRQVLSDTQNILDNHQKRPVNPYAKKAPTTIDRSQIGQSGSAVSANIPKKLDRAVTTEDLAYSKAKKQQLWVPFLEKAYAKAHGSYKAISGGHIAEAFLDLTGAPTKVYNLHNDPSFNPRQFWYQLLTYRRQRLPMGCGTDSSNVGIIGMHAYSIMDVREIRSVGIEFFREKLMDKTLGGVSGFTEFDGTVRLLRIRNPHGKGEWQGEFSDRSDKWEELLRHTQSEASGLERTMTNDGTFWIDYDSFLMGFANVDVVMAYQGNHGKSFHSHFPVKQSNHRCTRAFEVSLLDAQPGVPFRDTVELYVMGIQKTNRGARHGRTDRKVSYKICDMGILVGEHPAEESDSDGDNDDLEDLEFRTVEGEMMGFRRDGHYRLILDRKKNRRLVVMPVSFGHPAATDKERSFVVRFVADAPLLIRELPTVPRMDKVLQTFCFDPHPPLITKQRKQKLLLEDTSGIDKHGEPLFRVFQVDCLANRGGVVFFFLCVNNRLMKEKGISKDLDLSFSIEATCRGMMCRTEKGFLEHETLAKGQKFQASWRKFSANVYGESKTRLLMVLVQSGQDTEMGIATCKQIFGQTLKGESPAKKQAKIRNNGSLVTGGDNTYDNFGIFNGHDLLDSNERHAAIFGRKSGEGLPSSPNGLDAFDLELERALALSRGDLEMQEALELSKNNIGPFSPGKNHHQGGGMMLTEEEQLRLALEQSKSEAGGASGIINVDQEMQTTVAASLKVSKTEDKELEEAIKLSLKANKREVIDLESDEKPPSLPLPSPKKQKTYNDDEVIELLDDDEDDDAEEGASGESKTAVVKNAETDRGEEASANELSVEEKRRLAAEAAMKRFQAK